MADKLLYGSPPTSEEVSQGVLKLVVFSETADASGKTVNVDIYSTQVPNSIDWGDGNITKPAAFTAAPDATHLGRTRVQHVYALARPMEYAIVVEAANMRTRFNFLAGKLPIIDDVTRDGVTRPHTPDSQPQVFAERQKQLASTRGQMKVPPVHGGFVNR